MSQLSPFKLMNTVFVGLGISVGYGAFAATVLWFANRPNDATQFLVAYTTSFRTVLSLGLILGTALLVYRSQGVIPATIETAFTDEQLAKTDYRFYKDRFLSPRRSVTFAADFALVAFILFSYSRFPLSALGEAFILIAACAEYALGVYVGRKLCYAGMMLHALLGATVSRNLFKNRELDQINSYVHVASTLTIIFVYIHVLGYYQGPFVYDSVLRGSTRPFLLLPAVIAAPVLLIFNFYPRAVLRKVYGQSIDVEIKRLHTALRDEELSEFEKRSYLMEVDKMSRDELRYSLQLTLSDLPIGITILIMILQPFLGN